MDGQALWLCLAGAARPRSRSGSYSSYSYSYSYTPSPERNPGAGSTRKAAKEAKEKSSGAKEGKSACRVQLRKKNRQNEGKQSFPRASVYTKISCGEPKPANMKSTLIYSKREGYKASGGKDHVLP
eukprot:1976387-Amphidinium_carterae.1